MRTQSVGFASLGSLGLATLLLVLGVSACSDSGAGGDLGDGGDVGTDTVTLPDAVEETATDVDTGDAPPLSPGGFGWPCTGNVDCLSGWCVEGANGYICTKACSETCPVGFDCKSAVTEGLDIAFLCVPRLLKLCTPCTEDFQCNGGVCLQIEGTGQCAFACTETAGCLTVGEGLCVRPGALYLLVAGEPGAPLERVEVAPGGLPDSLTAQGDALTVVYVGARETATRELTPEQRVARVRWPSREVATLVLDPPEDFADIDRPSLVTCDDGIWMVTEVALARPDASPVSAVTALPLECLAH